MNMVKKFVLGAFLLFGLSLTAHAQVRSSVNATTIKNAMSCGDTSITANTITCSTFQGLTSYAPGETFFVAVANTTTGATTININSIGAKNVTKNGTTAIGSGDLQANGTYAMRYDGTEFVVIGNISSNVAGNPSTPLHSVQFDNAGVFGGVSVPATQGQYSINYIISCGSSSAVDPTATQLGAAPRDVSGTTDTILCSDNFNPVIYTGSAAVAVSLPTPTTLGNTGFSGTLINHTSGSPSGVTVTSTTLTFDRTGTTSLVIHQGEKYTITADPNGTTWDTTYSNDPLVAGTNVTITRNQYSTTIASSVSAVTLNYMQNPNTDRSGGNQAPRNGNVALYSFVPPANVTFSHIIVYIGVVDASNLYSFGIYTASGDLVASTTAASYASTGIADITTIQGSKTLTGGLRYYFAMTGNAATLQIVTSGAGINPVVNGIGSATTAGVLPATTTVSGDSWTVFGGQPYFALHP